MKRTHPKGVEVGTAEKLLVEAFSTTRDPRSVEYKEGLLVALKFRLKEITRVQCPYLAGTAQADAWFSGADEGHKIGRDYVDSRSAA